MSDVAGGLDNLLAPYWNKWLRLERWAPQQVAALSLNLDPDRLELLNMKATPVLDGLHGEYERRLLELTQSSLVIDGLMDTKAVKRWLCKRYEVPCELMTIKRVKQRIAKIEAQSCSVHRKRVEIANLYLKFACEYSVGENGDLIIQSTTEKFIEELVAATKTKIFESVEHLNPDAKRNKLHDYRSTLKHKRNGVKSERWAEWEWNGQFMKPIRFVA